MYIVREIFQLKFGQYRQAKALIDEGQQKGMFPDGKSKRILTDFTGASYRLILEEGYDTLADFEANLKREMTGPDWKDWYARFQQCIESSQREILKQVG
ncbi:MAG: hypothetical protein JNK00_04235 [Flavipsychrobacter sp.]|nr:hypothetical protein [Flavipsychrobacter sp.]